METTQNAATTILQAMRDMRSRKITADDFRSTMQTLRSQMSEADFTAAKFRAAANDR